MHITLLRSLERTVDCILLRFGISCSIKDLPGLVIDADILLTPTSFDIVDKCIHILVVWEHESDERIISQNIFIPVRGSKFRSKSQKLKCLEKSNEFKVCLLAGLGYVKSSELEGWTLKSFCMYPKITSGESYYRSYLIFYVKTEVV